MDSEKAYEQVLHGDSEVAVITLALESHHNINSKKIWNDPLRFICAQDHPLAELKKPALKDLAEYPIILPGLNTYTGRIIQNLFQKEGIPLKAPMSTNYLETISTMVEIGLGSSIYNSGFQPPLERRSITPAPERHPSEGTSPQRKLGLGLGLGLGLESVKKTLDFLLAKYQGVFNIYATFSDAI